MHKYSDKYTSLYQTHLLINNEDSSMTCDYILDYYPYGNSSKISLFCENGFFEKGLEMGISEAQTLEIRYINYLLNIPEIENIVQRKTQMSNSTLNYISDYSIFIFDPIMIQFINEYVNVSLDTWNGMRSFFIYN